MINNKLLLSCLISLLCCCDNTIKNPHNKTFTQKILGTDLNDYTPQVNFNKLFENNSQDINKTLLYYIDNNIELPYDDLKKVYEIIKDPGIALTDQSRNFLKFRKLTDKKIHDKTESKIEEKIINYVNNNAQFGNKYQKCVDELSSYINTEINRIYKDDTIEYTHKIYDIIKTFITDIFNSDKNKIVNFDIIDKLIDDINNDENLKKIIDIKDVKEDFVSQIIHKNLLDICIVPTIINKIKEKTDGEAWKSIIDKEFNGNEYGLFFTSEEINDKDELNKYKEYVNDPNKDGLNTMDFFIIRNRFEYWIFKILEDMKLHLVKDQTSGTIKVKTEENDGNILYYKCLIFTTFIIQSMVNSIELDDSGDRVICYDHNIYKTNILSTNKERNYITVQFIIKIIAIINYVFSYKLEPSLMYIQPSQTNKNIDRLDLYDKISVRNSNINDTGLVKRIQKAIIENILLGCSITQSDVNKNSIFSLTHHRNINIDVNKTWIDILNSFDYRYFIYLINDEEPYNWMNIIRYGTNNIPYKTPDSLGANPHIPILKTDDTQRRRSIEYKKISNYNSIMSTILDRKDDKHDPLDYISQILQLIQFLINGKYPDCKDNVLTMLPSWPLGQEMPIYKLDNDGKLVIFKYLNKYKGETLGNIDIEGYSPKLEYELDSKFEDCNENFYLSCGYCLALYFKYKNAPICLDIRDLLDKKKYEDFLKAFSRLSDHFQYENFETENGNIQANKGKKINFWNNINSGVYYLFETLGNIILLDSCMRLGDNNIIGLSITH